MLMDSEKVKRKKKEKKTTTEMMYIPFRFPLKYCLIQRIFIDLLPPNNTHLNQLG